MLTERDVRAILDTELPLRRLFLGDEFDTWGVGDDLVAKFPRTAYDAAKIATEAAAHPLLRSVLGDVVPAIRSFAPADGPAAAYILHERARGLQGQTVGGVSIAPGDGLAEDVGRLLGTLHQIEADAVSELGLGERIQPWEIPHPDAEARAIARQLGGDGVATFLASAPPAPSPRRTLCHTDIKGEHVFVDVTRRRVTGVIDWADVEICDPARDYAGLAIWLGPSFASAAIEASGEDDGTLAERAIWLARAGALDWIQEVLSGAEKGPFELIVREFRAAFGVSARSAGAPPEPRSCRPPSR